MNGGDAAVIATTTAAVGAGLAGGVFFAFSSFVMPALRRADPTQAIAAMQALNRQAPRSGLMVVLFGTAALTVGVSVHAALGRDTTGFVWAGTGTTSYLAAVALTAAYHVPRNDRLAALDAGTAEAADYWTAYLRQWTAGNHVRTLACIAAVVALTVAAHDGS